jgi:non-heme chloroperoxidase
MLRTTPHVVMTLTQSIHKIKKEFAMTIVNSDQVSDVRRRLLGASATAAVGFISGYGTLANAASAKKSAHGVMAMNGMVENTLRMRDGTLIYYKDWGTGQPVVFSHGWPLDADAWDAQMLFLGLHGYRVIAHDRRGHGRSSQPWNGNDMNTYADDLATLLDHLGIKDAMMVGHSTGGGEVARYIGRHGTERVSKAVLIGAVPPLMLKTDANPGGLPIEVFDKIRTGFVSGRSQFFKDLAIPFYGFNRPNANKSQGLVDSFWRMGMLGSFKGEYDCIKAFSETDFTEDLKKMTVPTLILHGDDDQIVPIDDSGRLSAKIAPNATLKVYPGSPHGMCETEADKVNADLLAFLKQ